LSGCGEHERDRRQEHQEDDVTDFHATPFL
jgi:hypothetical protein